MARNAPAQNQEVEEDDPWATSSGMPDKFVGYIEGAFFGVDEKYNPDAMLFVANLVDEQGEPVTTIKYSVGQDWEADADGTTITHPTKTKINNSSRFGRFIDRIAEPTTERAPKRAGVISPKGKENGLGLKPLLMKRGLPTTAASFEGLGFFWEQHTMETMGTDEKGQVVTKSVLLPTEFIGEFGKSGSNGASARSSAAPATRATAASRPAPTRAAARPAPAEEAAEEEEAVIDIAIPLRKRLTSQAQSSTVQQFLRWAAKDKEVTELPDDVMGFVLSGGAKGFWASVQPE